MGMFDTFISADGLLGVQTKIGPNVMNEYTVGDSVAEDFPSNVLIAGLEGFILIHEGFVVSVTAEIPTNLPSGIECITKWGGPFDPWKESLVDHHPFANTLKALDIAKNISASAKEALDGKEKS